MKKTKMIKHFKIFHGKLNNKTILNELVISIYLNEFDLGSKKKIQVLYKVWEIARHDG